MPVYPGALESLGLSIAVVQFLLTTLTSLFYKKCNRLKARVIFIISGSFLPGFGLKQKSPRVGGASIVMKSTGLIDFTCTVTAFIIYQALGLPDTGKHYRPIRVCAKLNRHTLFCCRHYSPQRDVALPSRNTLPRSGGIFKRANHKASHLWGFFTGACLGGEVSSYRDKQNIYTQGEPANTLFYIQKGGVRLSTRRNNRPAAVTAILGVGDFFGELCLADYPLRMCTAVAMTASTIRTIKKAKMIQILHKKNKTSVSLLAHLLSSVKNYRDHVADLLTSTAEQRLARVLLRLAHLDENGPASLEIPNPSHQVLAEMVGTTRPRINFFMNRFREQGYVLYDGGLEVHQSLRKILRK